VRPARRAAAGGVDTVLDCCVAGDRDLGSGDTQQLSVAATAGGANVDLPLSAVHWTIDPPSLGTISADGVFTAGTTNQLGTVTATAGGAHGSTSIAVGQTARDVDPLTMSRSGASATNT